MSEVLRQAHCIEEYSLRNTFKLRAPVDPYSRTLSFLSDDAMVGSSGWLSGAREVAN